MISLEEISAHERNERSAGVKEIILPPIKTNIIVRSVEI